MVLTVSSVTEVENILRESSINLTLVVIDFFATWCGPCLLFAPEFERMSTAYPNETVFIKVDCDQLQEFALKINIRTLPTVKGFLNNQEVFSLSGVQVTGLFPEIQNNIPLPALKSMHASNSDTKPKLYLYKIIENILTYPNEEKYRILKLSNNSVQTNLLAFKGVRECLLAVGFEAQEKRFYMRDPIQFIALNQYKKQLSVLIRAAQTTAAATKPVQSSNANVNQFSDTPKVAASLNKESIFKPVPRKSGFTMQSTNKFLEDIDLYRRGIDIYENIDLMNIVNALVDVDAYKSSSLSQETIIKKLLRWFKYDFFSWFNVPNCDACNKPYAFTNRSSPNSEEMKWLANTVEVYQCDRCFKVFRFPRYNHPERLLVTRTGRCGEWANCFSLILRTFINEGIFKTARFVHDWSDHVWCEVYMKLDEEPEPRWVHVDPCEATYNAPLIYQVGWNKQIDYIIGVSLITGDVQDVTWRYTNNFELVMSKRNLIDEKLLIDKLLEYHKVSGTDVKMIIKELVSFLPSKDKKSTSEKEMIGRTTGSVEWRLERGELGNQPTWAKLCSGQSIKPTSLELINNCIHIQYNCSTDTYYRPCDIESKYYVSGEGEGQSSSSRTAEPKRSSCSLNKDDLLSHDTDGWKSLAASWKNIKRKVEYDWQVVYLARMHESPPDAVGEISWTIDISGSNKSIREISVFASSAEFNNASVIWKLHSNDIESVVNGFMNTTKFNDCSLITLTAVLQSDPVATSTNSWQHAQLCRQKSTDFDVKTLQIKIELVDI